MQRIRDNVKKSSGEPSTTSMYMIHKYLLLLLLILTGASCQDGDKDDTVEVPEGGKVFDAIVDSKGKGDYTTVQAAIDAAPSGLTSPYKIFITEGIYNECILVRKNKSYIHLIGQSCDGVKIQYALNRVKDTTGEAYDYSIYNPNSPAAQAGYTTDQEALALIQATNFYAENISFINLYGALGSRYNGGLGKNGQADALMLREDRCAFYNCKLVSYQDTWWCRYPTNNTTYRAYAKNCWIEGKTDYIYGSGNVLIENSTLFNVNSGSVIVAGSHYAGTPWGFVLKDCTVDGLSTADGTLAFGRPWQNEPITVWINTTLKIGIREGHWTDMGVLPKLYAEYHTLNKQNADIAIAANIKSTYLVNGTSTSYTADKVLTADKAASYTYENIVKATDAWNPKLYMETPLAAPSNISRTGNTLTWKAVSGAAGYLIFMNGNYMGQTTTTAVTLTNTDEGSSFTVKTVSPYGTVSE